MYLKIQYIKEGFLRFGEHININNFNLFLKLNVLKLVNKKIFSKMYTFIIQY